MEHILTMSKPWILLIFALVVISVIGAFAGLAGVNNPLSPVTMGQSLITPNVPATPSAVPGTYALNGAAVLSLALWAIIAYGVAKGHAWTWWLLAFQSILALVNAVFGFLTAQPLSLVAVIVYVVLFAALFKKETVEAFKPNLTIVPALTGKEGLW